MKRDELLEKREQIVRELANRYLDVLGEAHDINFNSEQRERFALGAIYTISEEDLKDTERDFTNNYMRWIIDGGKAVLDTEH